MKTTIAINLGARLSVEPSECGGVVLCIETRSAKQEGGWRCDTQLILSQDQAGVLVFGIECAAEAADIAQDRKRAG